MEDYNIDHISSQDECLRSVKLPPILPEEVSGSLPRSGEYYYYAREYPRREVPNGDVVLDPRWRVLH